MSRSIGVSVLAAVMFAAAACQTGGAASAPGLSDADRNTLRQNDEAFAKAANAKNFASMAANYADDATVMPPNGEAVKGRDAIQKWLSAFPPMSDFRIDAVDIDGRGDLAYTSGTYSVTMTPAGGQPIKDRGKFVEIWAKQADGSWKIKRDIFNSDLPPAPMAAPTKS
jgi:uncharacterized protein (TIGR02246 family)